MRVKKEAIAAPMAWVNLTTFGTIQGLLYFKFLESNHKMHEGERGKAFRESNENGEVDFGFFYEQIKEINDSRGEMDPVIADLLKETRKYKI